MTTFAMFTNEGEIALAQKLNEALDAMPDDLNHDERFVFIKEVLLADSEFCANHGEWEDTAVRDSIYWWAKNPTKVDIRDKRATVAVEFYFPVEVTTLDDDARSVLDDKRDEINSLIENAVQDALSLIGERIGRIAGEWSGVQVRII